MSRSKRYNEVKSLVDVKKTYSVADAMDLVKKTATVKFDGSVDLHVRLGVDPKKSDQMVRGNITLPHSAGKAKVIIAFVGNAEKEKEAKDAGATIVGGEELIAEIAKSGKCDFEVAVTTPDMMPKLAKIAKILGPKGLMPSPKNETVSTNLKKAIEELKKGKINFKTDDYAIIHQSIGKVSMTKEQLIENFTAFVDAIRKAKPASSKGQYLVSVNVAATMGPGIAVSA
jgi:large subunit ribosomal protein L1